MTYRQYETLTSNVALIGATVVGAIVWPETAVYAFWWLVVGAALWRIPARDPTASEPKAKG